MDPHIHITFKMCSRLQTLMRFLCSPAVQVMASNYSKFPEHQAFNMKQIFAICETFRNIAYT